MKKVLIILALIFGANTLYAQTKIAHINVPLLLEVMPERDTIQNKLLAIESEWQSLLKDQETAIVALEEELVAMQNNPMTNPAIFEAKRANYEKQTTAYQQTRQTAMQDIQKKNQELTQPLYEKIEKAISEVAKAKGFDYVINSAEGSPLLYMNPEYDLLADVKAKLNL